MGDAAVQDCPSDNKMACAVDILAVVESAAWIAADITAVIGDCTKDESQVCNSGIAGMVLSITAAAEASSAMALNCPKSVGRRRRPYGETSHPVQVGNCVIDSWESAWAIARAGCLINSAVIT